RQAWHLTRIQHGPAVRELVDRSLLGGRSGSCRQCATSRAVDSHYSSKFTLSKGFLNRARIFARAHQTEPSYAFRVGTPHRRPSPPLWVESDMQGIHSA